MAQFHSQLFLLVFSSCFLGSFLKTLHDTIDNSFTSGDISSIGGDGKGQIIIDDFTMNSNGTWWIRTMVWSALWFCNGVPNLQPPPNVTRTTVKFFTSGLVNTSSGQFIEGPNEELASYSYELSVIPPVSVESTYNLDPPLVIRKKGTYWTALYADLTSPAKKEECYLGVAIHTMSSGLPIKLKDHGCLLVDSNCGVIMDVGNLNSIANNRSLAFRIVGDEDISPPTLSIFSASVKEDLDFSQQNNYTVVYSAFPLDETPPGPQVAEVFGFLTGPQINITLNFTKVGLQKWECEVSYTKERFPVGSYQISIQITDLSALVSFKESVYSFSIVNNVSAPHNLYNLEESSNNNNTPLIVGVVVGSVALLALFLIIFVVYYLRKDKRKGQKAQEDWEAETNYAAIAVPSFARTSKRESSKMSGNNWEIAYSEVKLGKIVGSGNFGTVYRGTWRSTEIAIKQLKLVTATTLKDYNDEITLMKNLRPHKNVVMFLGVITEPECCIVTEFCEKGSLYNLLKSSDPISDKISCSIARGIASGMLHLHREGIIHRDLAARNVLLTSEFVPKIGDFGLSRLVPEDDSVAKTDSSVGPLKHMAPECIRNREYSIKSDVWSFAVVLYEIFTRNDPYSALSGVQAAAEVAFGNLCPKLPDSVAYKWPQLHKLVNECCNYEPAERPDFERIVGLLENLSEEF